MVPDQVSEPEKTGFAVEENAKELPFSSGSGVDVSYHSSAWHQARLAHLDKERMGWDEFMRLKVRQTAREDFPLPSKPTSFAFLFPSFNAETARVWCIGIQQRITPGFRRRGAHDAGVPRRP